jgi:lipopolysaccharide export system permease protein
LKIWQRYLFSRLMSAFLFFLFLLLGLYMAIDFTLNGTKFFSNETASWLDIGLRGFAKFTPFFFSLSFLLAMLRVLLDLSAHRELIALQTAGLSFKKLLSPFFFLAVLLAALSYANAEWVLPEAGKNGGGFHKQKGKKEKVFSLVLQDGSELIYQSYDPEKKELFDVFWIRSFDEIWHMKWLLVGNVPFAGRFSDQFVRSEDGRLEKGASNDYCQFPELVLETGAALQRVGSHKVASTFGKNIPFENRPLSFLWRQAARTSSDQQKSAAHLHYKLALPLIPFFLIFMLAPFALSYSLGYSRSRSPLIFIACSLFAYVGLMTLLDAMLILAENQAAPAALSIWGPLFALFALSFYFFKKLL